MSGVPQKLQSKAYSSASSQYKSDSQKKRIRNKGAHISRLSKKIYVNALENQVRTNNWDIQKKKKIVAKTAAEIEELKNKEMRALGKLLFLDS